MKLFYSYSHKDEHLRDLMEKHLTLLKDEGYIDEWHDRKIQAGQEIHREIDKHLETSDLILLLLSPDFLASSECKSEMCKALKQREERDTIVIPVIVRPCAWKDQEAISDLKAIPRDGKPIMNWSNKDEAFLNIYEEIKDVVKKNPFHLKKEFRDDLTKVEFISQQKENIKLDDLFVFPNIESEYSKRRINGFENLWGKNKYVVLKGDDRSGKTVICRKLFLSAIENGIPTILISGSDITSPINHEQLIERRFREQFSGSYSYWQNKDKKLLIIDDLIHSTQLQFISFAKEYFERILIVVSEDEYIAYFRDEDSLANFELLTLEVLGHSKQEELIKKWMNLSNSQNTSQEISHGKIDQIEDSLNSIILHNRIVPRYPFYILSILQTFEAFMPENFQITAYGHCYQALITAQLISTGIQKEDIDSSLNFLSCFAFEIFKRKGEFSQNQFEQFLKEYNEQYIIKESVVNRLKNNKSSIIRIHRDRYEFNYPFSYYFQLGNFFARNFEKYKNLIEEIVEKSYLLDNAYILIFTIHHTRDDDLINTILSHTASAFDHVSSATLSPDETKLLEGTIRGLPEKILSNRSVEEERKLERERRDRKEADLVDLVTDESEEDNSVEEKLNEFYRALKNMEILGQIIKNKYGSLPKDKIEEIIDFVTDAGLRLINVFRDDIQNLEGYFIERLNNASISEDDKRKIKEFLIKQIRTMVFLIIGSLLEKVVISIRKPELLEIVEKIYQKKNTPAYDLLYTLFLLDTSEKLSSQNVEKITNTIGKFKKSNNKVAHRFISLSLQHYANTHQISHSLREKIFSALDLKYKPNPSRKKQLE